ncbi:MAG: hypothetical protein KJZ83_02510 [Burkholderiaceae bacterium]|nr:hypothetical protein [Burkholderiaceae bacterium]
MRKALVEMKADRIEDLIRPLAPFVAVMVAAIVVMILVPEIVLWVPKMFGYKST